MDLDEARLILSGAHFAKEQLNDLELQLLYAAEAVMGELDKLHGGYARAMLTDDEATLVKNVITVLLRRRQTDGALVTKTGRVLTDADIERFVEEAEAGYDVEKLRAKPNRALRRKIGTRPLLPAQGEHQEHEGDTD
jgi:hypothetical protein